MPSMKAQLIKHDKITDEYGNTRDIEQFKKDIYENQKSKNRDKKL